MDILGSYAEMNWFETKHVLHVRKKVNMLSLSRYEYLLSNMIVRS